MKLNASKLAAILAIYFAGQWAGFAQKRPLAQAPPAVKTAVHAQMAAISDVEKRIQNNGIVFDVSGQKGGREVELTVAANGQVLSTGNEVKLNELSAELQAAIRKFSANGRLELIVRQLDEEVTSYRLDLKKGTRDCSIELDENGNFLDEEVSVTIGEFPAVVQKTVRAEVGNGTIHWLGKMIENGVTSFTVAAVKDGKPLDFSVAANGDLEELEMIALDLPDPAQKTVQAQMGDGRIVRATKNSEDSDLYFAVEINGDKKIRTLNIADDGSLISEEEVLTLAQTPAVVQEAIKSKAAGAKLESLIKMTEDGAVSYDVELVRSDKTESLRFDVAGKRIEQK